MHALEAFRNRVVPALLVLPPLGLITGAAVVTLASESLARAFGAGFAVSLCAVFVFAARALSRSASSAVAATATPARVLGSTRTRRALLVPVFTLVLAALYAALAWLPGTILAGPGGFVTNGLELSTSDWLPAVLLKVAVLASLLASTSRAYAAIGDGRVPAYRAALVWSACLLAAMVPQIVFRERIAELLGSATTHLSSHTFIGYEWFSARDDHVRHEAWIAAWESGRIAAIECACALALAWGNALFARRAGRGAGVAALLSPVLALAVCLLFASLFGLVAETSTFHHGFFAAPLSLELAIPFWLHDPETLLAAPFLLAFAAANLWIAASASGPTPEGRAGPDVIQQPVL